MKTELITFDKAIELKGRKAVDFFSNKENLTPLVVFVKEEATSIVHSVDTKKGRDAIGSTALKVSKSRKGLTDAINASISEMETKVKTAKAVSKYVEQELNGVRDKILEPRKVWQAEQDLIEEKRIKDIKEDIDNILGIGTLIGNESKEEVASLVEAVESIDVSEGYEEFTVDAAQAVKDVLKTLNDKVLSIIEDDRKAEQDQQLEAEWKRNKITERLNNLAMIPLGLMGEPSSKIKDKIDSLVNFVIPADDFGESYQQAVDSIQKVIGQLNKMFNQQILIEEQAAAMGSSTLDLSPVDPPESMSRGAPTLAGMDEPPIDDFFVETTSTTTVIQRDFREIAIHEWLCQNTNIYNEQAGKIASAIMLGLLPYTTVDENEIVRQPQRNYDE